MLGPLGEAACKEGIVPSVVGWLRWNHPGFKGGGGGRPVTCKRVFFQIQLFGKIMFPTKKVRKAEVL